MGVQDRKPNFRYKGKLFLVRCFVCGDKERGKENWAPAVAEGRCAWCGWNEKENVHELGIQDKDGKRQRTKALHKPS